MKNIWIDLTNSPHVLFFKPIIEELKNRNYNVFITCRDYAQTKDLLDNYKLKYKLIGHHAGSNIFKKFYWLLKRSFLLYKYMKNKNINLALSHNSVDICVVSRFLKIPIIDIFDYEYASFHHINFRFANKIMFPKYINKKKLKKYGGKQSKCIPYEGLKEHIYLYNYNFDNNILDKINIKKDNKTKLVLLRPPATMALYHQGIKNYLYSDLIYYLSSKKNVKVIFMPRTNQQKVEIEQKNLNNFVILNKTVDGPSLIKKVDLVISGGGTMNREAVALNKPVYSILALKLGDVDKYLIKKNYLKLLTNVKDLNLNNLNFKKNNLKGSNPKDMVTIFEKYMK